MKVFFELLPNGEKYQIRPYVEFRDDGSIYSNVFFEFTQKESIIFHNQILPSDFFDKPGPEISVTIYLDCPKMTRLNHHIRVDIGGRDGTANEQKLTKEQLDMIHSWILEHKIVIKR